jgi:hypothetical protein
VSWRQVLCEADNKNIGEALRATVDGPFLGEDRLFKTLTGLDRQRVRPVAANWTAISDELLVVNAVTGSLVNLAHYPHRCYDIWYEYLSISPQEVAALSTKVSAATKADEHVELLRRQEFAVLLANWPGAKEESLGQIRTRPFLIRAADRNGVAVPDELRHRS